jgi:hypothetical protein
MQMYGRVRSGQFHAPVAFIPSKERHYIGLHRVGVVGKTQSECLYMILTEKL